MLFITQVFIWKKNVQKIYLIFYGLLEKGKKKKKFLVKNIIALCPVRVFVMKKVLCDDEAVLLLNLTGSLLKWKKFLKKNLLDKVKSNRMERTVFKMEKYIKIRNKKLMHLKNWYNASDTMSFFFNIEYKLL